MEKPIHLKENYALSHNSVNVGSKKLTSIILRGKNLSGPIRIICTKEIRKISMRRECWARSTLRAHGFAKKIYPCRGGIRSMRKRKGNRIYFKACTEGNEICFLSMIVQTLCL